MSNYSSACIEDRLNQCLVMDVKNRILERVSFHSVILSILHKQVFDVDSVIDDSIYVLLQKETYE